MPAARPSQATIRAALKAWQECGLAVGEVIIDAKAGTVRIVAPNAGGKHVAPKGGNTCDELFAGRSG